MPLSHSALAVARSLSSAYRNIIIIIIIMFYSAHVVVYTVVQEKGSVDKLPLSESKMISRCPSAAKEECNKN